MTAPKAGAMAQPLPPGAAIGILGGGQLGRMAALAAAELGYRCHVFTPEADSPAAQVTNRETVAAYDDQAALERFGRAVDVVTIEFENLPVAPLVRLAELVPVLPAPAVLAICQDRRREKEFLERIGVATAPWRAVGDAEDLAAAQATSNGPIVLKTARFGYDGKGQLGLSAGDDPVAAWARFGGAPAVAEARIDFVCEISVIAARGQDGSEVGYPPVENRHERHILAQTIAPAALPAALADEARALAARIARELEVTGLLAVEMFVTRDGRLLVNELAPRPHNSGHWTIDACAISQFELLVRALCGLPLVEPGRFADVVMDNLLGSAVAAWPDLLAEPGARLHLYGKREIRAGRKLGHVTRLTRFL
jgi:5-(carboxyamino)imidazole ribonucleotide synthase